MRTSIFPARKYFFNLPISILLLCRVTTNHGMKLSSLEAIGEIKTQTISQERINQFSCEMAKHSLKEEQKLLSAYRQIAAPDLQKFQARQPTVEREI